MKKQTMYISDDGQPFASQKACETYEQSLRLSQARGELANMLQQLLERPAAEGATMGSHLAAQLLDLAPKDFQNMVRLVTSGSAPVKRSRSRKPVTAPAADEAAPAAPKRSRSRKPAGAVLPAVPAAPAKRSRSRKPAGAPAAVPAKRSRSRSKPATAPAAAPVKRSRSRAKKSDAAPPAAQVTPPGATFGGAPAPVRTFAPTALGGGGTLAATPLSVFGAPPPPPPPRG